MATKQQLEKEELAQEKRNNRSRYWHQRYRACGVAFRMGMVDSDEGLAFKQCPYPESSIEKEKALRDSWHQGWLLARRTPLPKL